MCQQTRSETEIVYAQSKGMYLGSVLATAVFVFLFASWMRMPALLVEDLMEWLGVGWIALPLTIALGLVAAILGLLFLRRFDLYRRRELVIRPAERSLRVLEHHLLWADKPLDIPGAAVQEVLLAEEPWRASRTVWELWLMLNSGTALQLDTCVHAEAILPLAQTLSSSLAVPLRRQPQAKPT